MRWRVGRVLLLLFQALWLNVIVPGHQRGVVRLPGDKEPFCGACCRAESSDTPHREKSPPVHGDPAAHCAICFFAARVSPPVVIDWRLPPLGLLAILPLRAAPAAPSLPNLPVYRGRAPPGAA